MTTLIDLLDTVELALVPVHVPRPEASLRWVAPSELADPSPFLEGGEVVLTTGLETIGWSMEWDGYVQRLADVGVVAIGLAVGLTHERSPQALVAACRRHRMNLFEVPTETTFVAISRLVARLLEAGERAQAESALAVQRSLTESALRGDTAELVRQLAESGGGGAALVTPDGVFHNGPVGPYPELLDPGVIGREIRRMRPRGLRAASSVSAPGGALLVHPIGIAGQPAAYLAAAFPGRATTQQRGLVSTAVALLSLDAERGRASREVDRRLRARALELLLTDDLGTAALVLAARSPHSPVPLPRRAVVLRAAGPRQRLGNTLAALEADRPLSGVMGGELVVVIPARQVRALADLLAERGLRVGIGQATPTDRLSDSYETAGHALDTTTIDSPVASWDDHVRRGALSLIEPARAAAFARSFLASLDGPQRSDLVDTLHAFLRYHGSLLRVADDLGLHRNTVRNRLRHIEDRLGVSLDDPQVRVNAWIAIQADAQAG